MEEKLDVIIKLLVEIKDILSQQESVPIPQAKPKPVKKLTPAQQLKKDAQDAIAHHRELAKKRAKKMFAPEMEELRLLKDKLDKLEKGE